MPVQRRIKGVKGQAGVPATEYGEIKKAVKITLTPTAIASTDATKTGISRSELFERFSRTYQIIQELQHHYHLTVRTPFDIGEPYSVGATPLGLTGWNGKPDYEASGATLDEAVKNLVETIGSKNR